ncbi:hypothetical protein SAFG77S_05164 [Streptomyces afghaniensis]
MHQRWRTFGAPCEGPSYRAHRDDEPPADLEAACTWLAAHSLERMGPY